MKKALLIMAFCAISLPAAATYCGPGTAHAGQGEPWYPNRCNEVMTTPGAPSMTGTVTGQQEQLQGQLQAQQARARANASSGSASDAASTSSAQASGNGSNNQQALGDVNIGTRAAGSGDDNRVIVHPSMIPPSLVAINPQGNLMGSQSTCGPLMIEVREPSYALVQDFWGNTTQEVSGHTATPVLARDYAGKVVGYERTRVGDQDVFIGSMILMSSAILNKSMAFSGALGFIKASGSGGQIGGGYSSAVQAQGKDVTIIPCFIPVAAPAPVSVTFTPPPPRPVIKPRPLRKAPTCTTTRLPMCPRPDRG